MRFSSGGADQCRGSTLAQAQALAAKPGSASISASRTYWAERTFQFSAKFIRATREACDIVTDMRDDRRTRLERKHSIERRHAMNLGGRNVQLLSDVIDSASANPADAILHRVQHRQKKMTAA